MTNALFQLPGNFESLSAAKKRHSTLVKLVSRWPSMLNHPGVESMLNCTPEARCGREGCPFCMRAFRNKLLQAFHLHGLENLAWTKVSILPFELFAIEGQIERLNLDEVVQYARDWISRSVIGIEMVICGLNVAYSCKCGVPIGWQLRLDLLFTPQRRKYMSTHLRGEIMWICLRDFAFRLEQVDSGELGKALGSAYRSKFHNESTYFDERRRYADGSPHRGTKRLALTAQQLRDVTVWLAQYKVGKRLIFSKPQSDDCSQR